MPELPEVETTLRGIAPSIIGKKIMSVTTRCSQLRWPIPENLDRTLQNQTVQNILRRGKYLIIQMDTGALLVHLGMSGRLRLFSQQPPPQKHDHLDLVFNTHLTLRYTDPRRFGAILWTSLDPYEHPLLKNLGVEPLTELFNADYLFQKSHGRRIPIKPFIMDSKIVVGIGNIYAAEALFLAGIHPQLESSLLTHTQCERLVQIIKRVLTLAIACGGSTLKDFFDSEGNPGYFTQHLYVYGRKGQPCLVCKEPLQSIQLGQRATVFCASCQAY